MPLVAFFATQGCNGFVWLAVAAWRCVDQPNLYIQSVAEFLKKM